MRKIMVIAIFIAMFLAGSKTVWAVDEWIAYAVNDRGAVSFGQSYSEESAREAARHVCAMDSGSTCYDTVSVPFSWYLVVVRCPNGLAVGGSKHNFHTARQIASKKRGYVNCEVVRQRTHRNR